jgi:uncharacterized protein (DUF2236 family)
VTLSAQTVPETMLQRAGAEAVVALSAGRAFLLGLADPAIAQIVDRHAAYQSDIYGRLVKIAESFYQMGFGTLAEAERVGAHLLKVHRGFAARKRDAGDPDVFGWTLHALLETTVVAYETFVRPLTAEEAAELYADARLRLDVMRMASCLPNSYPEFRLYMRDRIETLEVTGAARRHLDSFLTPPDPSVLRPFTWFWRTSALWLLPETIAAQYRVRLARRDELAMRTIASLSRAATPRLPNRWRRVGLRMFGTPESLYDKRRRVEPMTAWDVARRVVRSST